MAQQPHPSTSHLDAGPIAYEMQTYAKGLNYERPTFTFQSSQWEQLACGRLSSDAKGYVYGSAGQRETYDKNLAAFRKWSIVPRRMVKTDNFPDTTVEILGHKLAVPIAMAPVGVQSIFHPLGERAAVS